MVTYCETMRPSFSAGMNLRWRAARIARSVRPSGNRVMAAMLLTLPFVLYGIFRLLYLMHHHGRTTEEPDILVYKDRPLLACVVLWSVTSALIIALGG